MKIAIEAQRIFRKNKHGMDFVALETILNLQKIDKVNQYYILVSPGDDRCVEETENFKIIELKCPSYPLWEQVAVPLALKKIKPDILHCTSNTAPIMCSVPLIVTIHDIIYLEKRQGNSKSLYQNLGWYYRRFVVPRILPKCKMVITVSNFECNRMKESLKLGGDKIKAIYNGYSTHFKPLASHSEVTKKYIDTPSQYMLFLGNTDPKKNTARTLKAYSIYLKKSEHKRALLVADLKKEYLDAIIKENSIEEIRDMIHIAGYIPNSDLPYIYNGAFAFLYTSLRESFGIPLLEAMACGTPVITSNTSSMPEVGGEGAILTDPFNEEDIAEMMLKLERDSSFYASQVAYGKERAKLFSWENTAKATLEEYKSIIEKK